MSHDPFPGWSGLPASQHGYSYVHNNPVNLTDPTGKFVWFVPIIAAGVLYGTGYLIYNHFVPQDLDPTSSFGAALTYGAGLFLGYENLRHDLDVLRDPCASLGRKAWALGDAGLNTVLGISMTSGVLNSVKAIPTAARLIHSGSITTDFGKILLQPAKEFYRTGRIIKFNSNVSGQRLWGNVAHEVAHAQQEYAVGSQFAKYVTRPLLQLSEALTPARNIREIHRLPLVLPYSLNPIEVHAAASGLNSISNWALLGVSRITAAGVTYLLPELFFESEPPDEE